MSSSRPEYLEGVNAPAPITEIRLWRNSHLFDIDFAWCHLRNHRFPRHFHEHYVFEIVINGRDCFYCNGNNYVADRGDMVFIAPGEVHTGSTEGRNPLTYFCMYPDAQAIQNISEAMEVLPGDLRFSQPLVSQRHLARKYTALAALIRANEDILSVQEAFYDVVQLLLAPKNAITAIIPHSEDQRVKLLRDFLQSSFQKELSLQQMAKLVNINPFYMVRLFKRHTGMSPYEYLLVLRTEQVKRLLRKGHKVHEAASAAGFYDTAHLNRSFRKINGTSPKSFHSSKGQDCTIFSR